MHSENRFTTPEMRIQLIKRYAKKLGVTLEWKPIASLELYCDVSAGGKDICYISRGDDDPGYRIGDIIDLPKNVAGFKEKFCQIFKLCSRDFISLDLMNTKDGSQALSLEACIYASGFNEKVLKEVMTNLVIVKKKIKRILAG